MLQGGRTQRYTGYGYARGTLCVHTPGMLLSHTGDALIMLLTLGILSRHTGTLQVYSLATLGLLYTHQSCSVCTPCTLQAYTLDTLEMLHVYFLETPEILQAHCLGTYGHML